MFKKNDIDLSSFVSYNEDSTQIGSKVMMESEDIECFQDRGKKK